MISGCCYAITHSSHTVTANRESLTPNCGLSEVPVAEEGRRGLLAAPLPAALPSLSPSVGHTHISPHPYTLSDTFSHSFPLTHTCAHRCRQFCSLPHAPPHTHFLHIALQMKTSLFPRPRRLTCLAQHSLRLLPSLAAHLAVPPEDLLHQLSPEGCPAPPTHCGPAPPPAVGLAATTDLPF